MLHRMAEKSLLDLAQGDATPWAMAFLRGHLNRCERCRSLAQDLVQWEADDLEPPAELLAVAQALRSRVAARLGSQRARPQRLVSPWFFPALGAAAFGVSFIVLLSRDPQFLREDGSAHASVKAPIPSLHPSPAATPASLSPTAEATTEETPAP